MRPLGVLINMPRESGMEWIVLKKPTVKCFMWIDDSSVISMSFTPFTMRCSSSFLRISAQAKRGA